MSKMSSSYRAAKRMGDDPSKKLTQTPISNPVRDEMENRRYAKSPDNSNTSPMESNIKSSIRKEYEQKDKDMRSGLDKANLQAKVKRLESREEKMGGSKAVTRKIKRREKVNKALPWVAGSLVGSGVVKMVYDEIQRQKKVEK
jgi:hypothetical protein